MSGLRSGPKPVQATTALPSCCREQQKSKITEQAGRWGSLGFVGLFRSKLNVPLYGVLGEFKGRHFKRCKPYAPHTPPINPVIIAETLQRGSEGRQVLGGFGFRSSEGRAFLFTARALSKRKLWDVDGALGRRWLY